AFYMFRLWFYTFAGEPRDHHVYEHAHESPWVMTVPLIVLSLFAAGCAYQGEAGFLFRMLIASEPAGVSDGIVAAEAGGISLPAHSAIALKHATAGGYALIVAILGMSLAYVFYGARLVDPAEVRRQFAGLHA